MAFFRSRRTLAILALLIIGAPTAYLLARPAADEGDALVATATAGDFAVTVTTAGELRASSFVQVQGPMEMQRAGAFNVKIASLVPEGTIVKPATSSPSSTARRSPSASRRSPLPCRRPRR